MCDVNLPGYVQVNHEDGRSYYALVLCILRDKMRDKRRYGVGNGAVSEAQMEKEAFDSQGIIQSFHLTKKYDGLLTVENLLFSAAFYPIDARK